MEPIVTVNLSVYKRYGDRVEVLLRNEQERKGKNKLPKTGIFAHQVDAALATMKFLNDSSKPSPALVIAPTGSGKTGILGLIPYLMRSRRTMILTPSPIISEQINKSVAFPSNISNFFEKTFCFTNWNAKQKDEFLPDAAVITSSNEIGKLKNDLVIVNAQRLGGNSRTKVSQTKEGNPEIFGRVWDFFSDVDLLIVDEAHHFPAPTWLHIKKKFEECNPRGHMVFITATVKRMLKNKLKRILPKTHEAFAVTKEQLETDVIRHLKTKNVDTHLGINSLELKLDLVTNIGRILREHDKIEPRFKHQALILVKKVEIAEHLALLFNKRGANSARAITGGMNARKDDIQDFMNGKFRVAIVCKMLIEGFDNPSISLCAIFRKVQSRPYFEQFLGRCLRRKRFAQGRLDCTPALLFTYNVFEQEKHCEELNLTVADNFCQEEEDEVDFY